MVTSTGAKINYLHFLLSLEEAENLLIQQSGGFYSDDTWASGILALMVGAVLDKESLGNGDQSAPFADAVDEIEHIGFAKQSAYELANQLFDIIATTITEVIPDFGDDRYRDYYEYEIRGSLVLHLVVHTHSFG
jgi:hypothetical protein